MEKRMEQTVMAKSGLTRISNLIQSGIFLVPISLRSRKPYSKARHTAISHAPIKPILMKLSLQVLKPRYFFSWVIVDLN